MEELSRADATTLDAMGVESFRRSAGCSPERSAHALLSALGAQLADGDGL
jgi:hypothetical protein